MGYLFQIWLVTLIMFGKEVASDTSTDTECRVKIDKLSSVVSDIDRLKSLISDQEASIAGQSTTIANLRADVAGQNVKIAQQYTTLAEQNAKISQQDATIANLRADIAEQNTKLAKQETEMCLQQNFDTVLQNLSETQIGQDNRLTELGTLLRNTTWSLKSEDKKMNAEVEELLNVTMRLNSTLQTLGAKARACACSNSQDLRYNQILKTKGLIETQILLDEDNTENQKQNGSWGKMNPYKTRGCNTPTDCQDIQSNCSNFSGVYTIYPRRYRTGVDVYCDMDTDGGGWTAFLIRKDGTENFDRPWRAYKQGFGDTCGEYWLGNDIIHEISSQGQYELRVDLEDFDKNTSYAAYHTFAVSDENSNYTLTAIGYSGTAGDGLAHHNGKQFSTYEVDNDVRDVHCAGIYRAGFWYGGCHSCLPTGKYLWGDNTQYARGVVWQQWKGYYYSLKTLTMKIRRKI